MKQQKLMSTKFSILILSVLFTLALPVMAAAQGKIAFVSNRDGNDEIYVMNSDGTNQVRLTSNSAVDRRPSFSAGGGKIVFNSARDGSFEIYVMNPDGSGQTRLTNNGVSDTDPAFSPDSSKIIFISDRDGNSELYVMDADGSNQTRLTNFAGADSQPSFSPDGSKIVFVRDDEIFVMNADGSNVTQLTFVSGLDVEPAFSPDGSEIVFTSARDTLPLDTYVMNADGSGPVRLTNDGMDNQHPVFSPDGTKIAVVKSGGFSPRDPDIWVMNSEGGNPQPITTGNSGIDTEPTWTDATLFPPDLSNVDVIGTEEGGTATLLADIFSANPTLDFALTVNWGDGSEQVFNYPAGTTSISETHQYLDNLFDLPYTVNVTLSTANGSDAEATIASVFNVAPALFVNQPLPHVIGSPLTLSGNISDPGSLDTQTLTIAWGDGSANTVLNLDAGETDFSANHTYATTGAYNITVSATDDDGGSAAPQNILMGVVPPPTSGKIAFASNFAGNNNIYLMNSNGTNQVALTTNPASDSYPDLSTDGSKVVFVSDRDGNPEIYIMNSAGAFQTRLTNTAGTESEPMFSPDGSKIVFSSTRDGNHEIYIMNADGTGQTRLTTNALDDGQAEFSPDGTKIIFSRLAANQSDAHIITMDLTGANQVPLTSGSFVLNGYPSYSPNGQKIVFSRANLSHTNAEIYVMDANGANAVRLTTAAGQDLEAAFSPNGSKIVFRSERDGKAEIYIMDANGANQQRITFDGAGVSNFAPSWSDASVINVDVPDDLAGEQGTTLIVPIIVSDTTNKGVIAYDFTLIFDPTVLELQSPAFEKSGTLSSGFEVNAGSTSPGLVTVSAFGTAPLSGGGTLINLKFNVIGTPPTSSLLTLHPFIFNEGIPFSELSSGQVFVRGTISGRVTYGNTTATVGVPDVSLSGSGVPSVETTTETDGTYRLGGFGPGAYTITPSKTGDVNGISAFDASLVSQFLVGATSLTANQQIAAEVSGDGTVRSFDAALIAQYVVGIPNTGSVGAWRFNPSSRSYQSVASLTGEDYSAILMGEVSGNWAPTLSPALDGLRVSEARRPPKFVATVSIPAIKTKQNQPVRVPLTVGFTRPISVHAYQFEVAYDPAVLQLESAPVDTDGTVSVGLSTVSNPSTPGRLRIAVYGVNPITGNGTLLNLRFRVIGVAGSSSALTISSLMFNEGEPAAESRNGSVSVRR